MRTALLTLMLVTQAILATPSLASTDGQHRGAPCEHAETIAVDADGSIQKPARLVELERRHEQAPDDVGVTKELVAETFALAQYFMYCSPASPKLKYPAAYCLYGRVLELDEEHAQARDAHKIIADIYASLEKELPGCPER
jgi:hypothetical protein